MEVDVPKKTKYIYVSGHSYLRPSMNYVGPFQNVEFVNLVEPDTLCYDTKDAVRSVELFSGLDDETRERVLQPFLRDMRVFSTQPGLREGFVSEKPFLSERVTDQIFSIRKQRGLVLGIWDLDEVREDPGMLQTPGIFGDALPDEPIQISISQIVDLASSRYPGHPLIVILSGCRITISADRAAQLRETEGNPELHSQLALSYERRPEETTSGQLAEGLGLGLDIGAGKEDGPDKMDDDTEERDEQEARKNEALWNSLLNPPEEMEGIKGGYRGSRLSKRKAKARMVRTKRTRTKTRSKQSKLAKSRTKTKRKSKTKVTKAKRNTKRR